MSFQITSFLRTKVDTQKKNLTHPHAKKKEYVLRYPNYHRRSIRSLEHHHQERRHPSVRARTALLFLVVGIYFSPLSFSLSIYMKHLARVLLLHELCYSTSCENVKMWIRKKKNAPRALLLEVVFDSREKERDAAETFFALAFSPREEVSWERKSFFGTQARVLNFLVFFFINVYTFPTATKTRRQKGRIFFIFFSFFLSLFPVSLQKKSWPTLSSSLF